MEVIRARGRDR